MYFADPTPLAGSGNQPVPAGTPAPSPAPAGQPAAGDFKMPEKFANAKIEDVVKSYVELEGKYGEQGKRLGSLSEYEKYGKPNEVGEAIQWARDVYGKMQRGELTPKQAAQAVQSGPQSAANAPQTPWTAEGWEFLPPAEQAAKMQAFTEQALQTRVTDYINKIAAGYGQQIEQMRASSAREQSIMLQTLQAALESGGKVDIKQALETAAEMANRPPEELIKLAIQNMTSPAAQQAEIERQVTARVAEMKQKMDNDNIDNLNRIASPTPRFATKIFNTRNDENRAILDKLQKDGIRLS